MSDVTKLSVSEVERLLLANEDDYGDYGWHSWDEHVPWGENKLSDPVDVPGLGPVQMVHTYTGGEGGGEDAELVFKIGDRYFHKQGYYASHDGTHWDGDFSEVRPEPKTITVYVSVR